MSLHVTGFRIHTNDFTVVYETVMAFQKKLKPQQENKINTFMANMASTKFDRIWLGLDQADTKKLSAATYALNEFRQALKNMREHERHPLADTDFNMSLTPHNGYVYGMVFTEEYRWFKSWLKQPGVEEYSYQNQTDKPNHITAKAWQERAETWCAVLDKMPGSVPAGASFSFESNANNTVVPIKKIIAHIPSLTERAKHIAGDLVCNAYLKEQQTLQQADQSTSATKKDKNAFSSSMIMRFIRSPEYQERLDAQIKEIELILIPVFTSEVLLETLCQVEQRAPRTFAPVENNSVQHPESTPAQITLAQTKPRF